MEDEVAPLIESFAWGHFHRCHQLDELPVKVARKSLVDGGKLLRDLISFIHITALMVVESDLLQHALLEKDRARLATLYSSSV